MKRSSAVAALFLLGALPALASAPRSPPGFAVRTADGTLHVYDSNASRRYSVSNDVLVATVSVEALEDEWQLEIGEVKQAIAEVYFPWFQRRWPLDSDLSDDSVYYPFAVGFTE